MISRNRHKRHWTQAVTLAVALLGATIVIPGMAHGQGTLQGRVIDSETGLPLPRATVTVARSSLSLSADSSGRFVVTGVPEGEAQLAIRLLGYSPGDFKVFISGTGGLEEVFPLDFTGNRLPAAAVHARAEALMPRYSQFEQRRQRATGAFLRWDELYKESYGSVGDALRHVRGIRIKCDQQSFECYAVMSRTPQCQPTWIIDGMEARSFHESTPVQDIYGIEIYRGPGEVPGEFSGSNAACGVIVMWTKSRPFRAKP